MNFWDQFEQASCVPHNCNCEFIRDALIRQPSSSLSSLAYLFLAYWLYREVKVKSFDLKAWTLATVMLGFASLFGHASFTRFILSMDFASIILILSFFALYNLLRLLKVRPTRMIIYFSVYYLSLMGMMYYMEKWTKISICVLIFLFAMGDLIREMGWSFLKARMLQYSLIVLVVSFSLFIMDELRILCDPHSLFQLHSFWHIGTAISIYLYGKWRFSNQTA